MIISLEQNNHDILTCVATKALSYTPQLFVRSKERPEEPIPFASGILVRWKGRSFLLTAGHCIQDSKGNFHEIGLIVNGHFHIIDGLSFIHADPSIDLGFVMLTEASEQLCASVCPFLPGHLIQQTYLIRDSDQYIIAGYPTSKTDVNITNKKISKESFVLHSLPKPPSAYKKCGFTPEKSILTSFHRRKSSFYNEEAYHKSPEPYGISGSGLWCVPSFVVTAPDAASFYLVGIMTEYHPDQGFLHANHIVAATQIMDKLVMAIPE